jgi:hypothetical protein
MRNGKAACVSKWSHILNVIWSHKYVDLVEEDVEL